MEVCRPRRFFSLNQICFKDLRVYVRVGGWITIIYWGMRAESNSPNTNCHICIGQSLVYHLLQVLSTTLEAWLSFSRLTKLFSGILCSRVASNHGLESSLRFTGHLIIYIINNHGFPCRCILHAVFKCKKRNIEWAVLA